MQNPYSEGDYVDCKHQAQGWWCVARILAKDGESLRIRFDGMTSKNDILLKWNSLRIAPFRRHTAILVISNRSEMIKISRSQTQTASLL